MPKIEEYTPGDLADIVRSYRKRDLGLGDKYPLPDFSDPMLVNHLVARSDDGEFIGCAFQRRCVEASLVFDPQSANHEERMESLWNLQEGSADALRKQGFDRGYAFIAPKPEGFRAILEKYGWCPITDRTAMMFRF